MGHIIRRFIGAWAARLRILFTVKFKPSPFAAEGTFPVRILIDYCPKSPKQHMRINESKYNGSSFNNLMLLHINAQWSLILFICSLSSKVVWGSSQSKNVMFFTDVMMLTSKFFSSYMKSIQIIGVGAGVSFIMFFVWFGLLLELETSASVASLFFSIIMGLLKMSVIFGQVI